MKALLLAAGEGTRLRPLTERCPKPMLPIGGRPLLAYTVELCRNHGVHDIAINLRHQPHVIPEFFGEGNAFGVRITYSLENPILGTAGAVKKLEWFLDETFFVIYGDVLTDIDLTALAKAHHDFGGLGTLALYEVPDPELRGIVELNGSGRVTRFLEKPRSGGAFSNLANAGVYVLEPEVLAYIPRETFFDFGKNLFPLLLERNAELYGHRMSEHLIDIGSFEHYNRAQREIGCFDFGRNARVKDKAGG